MKTIPKKTGPGPLREDDLLPDDIIHKRQQPQPPKGNQDEQARQGEDTSEEIFEEEADNSELDELLEEEKITDEDVDKDNLEEDDAEKGPLKD